MSIFTSAVLMILALATLCALIAFRIRSGAIKNVIFGVATCLLVLATWLGATDAWAFRDGFPLPSPKLVYTETHGLDAAKAFILGFWVSLLAAAATAAMIATSWRHGASRRK